MEHDGINEPMKRTSCEHIRPAMMDYLLEEASTDDRSAIRQHLESCAACAEEVRGLQATLGVVQQGGRLQDVPQHFRFVGEPSGWLLAFWRNSSRLAFSAAALACVSIAMLALLRTTVSYRQGDFEIAFGAAPTPAQFVTDVAPQPAVVAAATGSVLNQADVLRLLSEAIAASEAKQQKSSTLMVNAVAARADEQRKRDWRDMAESLRSFQAAQVTMWKEQVQSQQYVGALMRNAGLNLPPGR